MRKSPVCLLLALAIFAGLISGCQKAPEPSAPAAEAVTLRIAGSWEDCKAIEAVGRAFTAQYPECAVVYEYLQDYYNAVEKRMSGEAAVDIFFTNNIQEGSSLLPYALDFGAAEGLKLADTFDGLIDNFSLLENGARTKKLYAIPLGAELRGLYVNKTLLDSLNIEIPGDQASLLDACAQLAQKGYIPLQGNPGDFSQTLLYPWVCNLVANAQDPAAAYAKVNAREPGFQELFRAPFEFLYGLVEKGYYDYKRAQTELDLFNETTDQDYARYFFNIRKNGDAYEKADDIGQVPFLPAPMSLQGVMNKTREDYHSAIEYAFVLSPVGPKGGFAYMSPAHGIAANKNSARLNWVVRFIDFLFQPENNKLFAGEFGIIPNTREAFGYIETLFEVPKDRIAQLGQVTFDYDFYEAVTASLRDLSKANNPKYMQENADGTKTLYPFEYYWNSFEERIAADA